MTTEQRNEVVQALVDFVKGASQKGATAEEITALPAVASVLLNLEF